MTTTVTMLLRLTLITMFLGALLAQLLVPVVATEQATLYPEVEHLVLPYSVAAILGFVCVQAALVAVWRLLSMVGDDRIFADGSLRWVDTITVCSAAATGLSAVVWVHLILVEETGGPGMVLALGACVVGGAALALLMVVMRGLLDAAIADRRELAEVI